MTFNAAGQSFRSRLELTIESNAANTPHLFMVYFGGSEAMCAVPTLTPTATPTSNRPPPIPHATASPNPARSGQLVTLDGSASEQPFQSAQWSDDQGHELTPGLIATFVAPEVTTETTLLFHLFLQNYGGSPGASTSIAVTVLPASCTGDCNDNYAVTIDELLTMVNIALGNADVSECNAGDENYDQGITVDEILTAVSNALNGC